MRLIDAEPIKKFIVDGLNNPDLKKAFGHDAIEILTEIEYAPTVDAVPVVHGRWIWDEENECWVCSNCEMSALNNYRGNSTSSNYCPNCGAKMDGGNEDGQE